MNEKITGIIERILGDEISDWFLSFLETLNLRVWFEDCYSGMSPGSFVWSLFKKRKYAILEDIAIQIVNKLEIDKKYTADGKALNPDEKDLFISMIEAGYRLKLQGPYKITDDKEIEYVEVGDTFNELGECVSFQYPETNDLNVIWEHIRPVSLFNLSEFDILNSLYKNCLEIENKVESQLYVVNWYVELYRRYLRALNIFASTDVLIRTKFIKDFIEMLTKILTSNGPIIPDSLLLPNLIIESEQSCFKFAYLWNDEGLKTKCYEALKNAANEIGAAVENYNPQLKLTLEDETLFEGIDHNLDAYEKWSQIENDIQFQEFANSKQNPFKNKFHSTPSAPEPNWESFEDETVKPLKRKTMSKEEAEAKAKECFELNPRTNITARELAEKIGCSTGLVASLEIWKKYQEERKKPKAPNAIGYSPKMDKLTGKEDETLNRLIEEQEKELKTEAKGLPPKEWKKA